MRYLHITLTLWKWEGVILAGGTPADFAKWAKRYIDADISPQGGAMGHAYVEMDKPWLLWLGDIKDVATLAHEALHITSGVLEARGLKHTDASEEAYTYTMEAIVRAVATAKQSKWRKVTRL